MQKNILITGAAKRIGATCARLLHSEGCNIFLHYRSSYEEAFSLCSELNQIRPDSAKLCQADLVNSDDIANLAHEASLAWGGIDVLINNASCFYPTDLDAVTVNRIAF
jgi:pteridine reductase